MKNIRFRFLKNIVTIIIVAMSFSAIAQGPPNPPGGSGGTTNNSGNQNGGNAPIGGGLFILIGLGVAYGSKKIYDLYKEGEQPLEE